MRNASLTRIAVLSTAAALCLGTAVPASAHSLGSSSDRDAAKTTSAPTVAQLQAWVDSFIAKRQQQLSAFASKIAADPKLTDAQQADFAAKLAKQQSVLSNLKNAVDSASTVEAVHQAIRSAMAADGVHGNFGWCGFFGLHGLFGMHGADGLARHRAEAEHRRTGADHPKADPGKVKAPTSAVRTVAVRTSNHRPTLQPDRAAGQHRSYAGYGQHNRSGDYQARHDAGGFASQSGRHHR